MEVKNKITITITIVALIATVAAAASLTSLVRLAFADCNPATGATGCSPWQLGWMDAYYNYYGGSPAPGHHSAEYMNGFQVGLNARVHGDATHPPAIAPTQMWQDFGNFGTILGFKANFPTGFAYNGSGVFIPWSKVCGQGQAYLVQPCSALIDSNGVLTDAGNHAVHCIRNGVILGVVAIKLGLPVNVAKSIIGGLAGMTGCSGIVDMNKIKLSNETQFLVRNIGQ